MAKATHTNNTVINNANWNQQYRPRRARDLHSNVVREAVLHLMKAPHFPQALLFAGPKGTGKTSVARIIGAMLNDPINDDAVIQRFASSGSGIAIPLQEPDPHSTLSSSIFTGQSYVVQELDAASNRGIDDVRALKERCALPPSQGRITVFILDEVHMLTIEAFNALLKLLEEPPPHVIFVLATTELQKVPATIASRCHVIQFQKATPAELKVPLQTIIADQKLTVDAATIDLITLLADGSFRDAVKLLQQFVQQASSDQQVSQLAETLSDSHIAQLIQAVVDKDAPKVADILEKLRHTGTNEQYYVHALITFLHQDLLRSLGVVLGGAQFPEKVSRFFLQELSSSELNKPSAIPFLHLELVFLAIIDRAKSKASGNSTNSSGKTRLKQSPSADTPLTILVEPVALGNVLDSISSATNDSVMVVSTERSELNLSLGNGQLLCEKWQEFVAKATRYNYGWAALLRSAQPIGGGEGEVVLRVFYSFHREQLLQRKWQQFWDELTTEVAGGIVSLDCIVESLAQTDLAQSATMAPTLSLEALAVDALMH